MPPSQPVIQLHPYHTNLSPVLAQQIIQDWEKQLPILDNIVILMPNFHASTQLREHITLAAEKRGYEALLGPQIYTLKDYIEKNTLLDQKRIPSESRELILIQALEQNRGLFGEQNLLTIAYALLELFDELTRQQISLPANVEDFILQLETAYQCSDTKITALSQEATIIHTLWQAWHEQLNADNILDLETHYQLKLNKNLQQNDHTFFYIAGYYEFLPSEIQWIKSRLKNGSVSLFFHGESEDLGLHPSSTLHRLISQLAISPEVFEQENPVTAFLDAVYYNDQIQFQQRAEKIKQDIPNSPIKDRISSFEGQSFEEEARAIELQVRAWMAENIKHIALIIEDRMLARRVRALLEQSGIGLKDMEGWALSTSSAASIIESWLQTIEENFHHLPLLDVIKSPFALGNFDVDNEATYRFEQDIVHRENISSDLNRYRKACLHRQHRLNAKNLKTSEHIITLLNHIESAAKPLQQYLDSSANLSVYLDALECSLKKLGCLEKLEQDHAGEALLELFQSLKESVKICDIKMDWLGFRHWLGKKMEESTFQPETEQKYYVELLHLTQTPLGHYEALIIGSMTQDSFPGSPKQTPFFNQSVRTELKLPAAQLQIQSKFYHFRRLLESAPKVLLTMHIGPQENLPSAWLSLLKNFHQLAYDLSLENTNIKHWLKATAKIQTKENKLSTAAVINNSLLPTALSASAHQTLINCPYAFFAAQVLGLRAPDEIRDIMAKSDYGERIHLCLQAFHDGSVKHLPGPFSENITRENRDAAIAMLTNISRQVFSQDIEDNFQHRGWLKRWLQQIPKYIDWEMAREKNWQFKTAEVDSSKTLANGIKIHGRVDRMDALRQQASKLGIIDYKTGNIPKKDDLLNGEAVQLTHYALSSGKAVTNVEYLVLEDGSKKQVISRCTLEENELTELTHFAEQRLIAMYQMMQEGKPLQAWGTEKSCCYCTFKGLCRKQFQAT